MGSLKFLGLLLPFVAWAESPPPVDSLKVEYATDGTATISGPSSVLEKINQCKYTVGFQGPGGNGLTVDWGDGNVEPKLLIATDPQFGQSCAAAQRAHKYAKSGSYVIHVRAWHPGPADAPVTDWEGSYTVVAGEGGAADNVSLNMNVQIHALSLQECVEKGKKVAALSDTNDLLLAHNILTTVDSKPLDGSDPWRPETVEAVCGAQFEK